MGSMKDMMGGMSKENMPGMMGKMMEECCAGMTAEDKKKMMEKMMPGMMEECNMLEMMPRCLGMMLSKVPKEKRLDLVLKMVAALMEGGCAGMKEEEKKDFAAKVAEKVKA
jgi:hypothetical protein